MLETVSISSDASAIAIQQNGCCSSSVYSFCHLLLGAVSEMSAEPKPWLNPCQVHIADIMMPKFRIESEIFALHENDTACKWMFPIIGFSKINLFVWERMMSSHKCHCLKKWRQILLFAVRPWPHYSNISTISPLDEHQKGFNGPSQMITQVYLCYST